MGIAIVLAWGCSGRGGAPPSRASDPERVTAVDAAPGPPAYTLPAYEPGPAFETVCLEFPADGATRRGGGAKIKRYDFEATSLPMRTDGPRLAEQSRAGFLRSPLVIEDLLYDGHDHVTDCWRWASAKAKKPEDLALTLELEVDPWGLVDRVAVDGAGGSDELRTCVEEAYAGRWVVGMSTTRTRASAELAFTLEQGLRKWKKKPRRPAKPGTIASRHEGKQCAPVLRDAVAQEISIPTPLAITDWDDSRVPPPPKGSRRPSVPSVRIGCSPAQQPDVDKRLIRATVHGNDGAFGACHVAARERDPSLEGEVQTPFVIGTSGSARAGAIEGDGDAELHDCLRAAIDEMWFHPAPWPIHVTWVWTLDASADDDRDPDAALEAAVARLAEDLDGPDSCMRRGELLEALLERQAWRYDARVRTVIGELVADAAARPTEERRACLEAVRGTLDRIAPGTADFGFGVHERVAYYETLLPVAGDLDVDLRWDHVVGLSIVDRPAALVAGDAYLAANPDDESARSAMEQLKATGRIRTNRCID